MCNSAGIDSSSLAVPAVPDRECFQCRRCVQPFQGGCTPPRRQAPSPHLDWPANGAEPSAQRGPSLCFRPQGKEPPHIYAPFVPPYRRLTSSCPPSMPSPHPIPSSHRSPWIPR